jgi:hypothetical protein
MLITYMLRNLIIDSEWEPVAYGSLKVRLQRKRESRVRMLWLLTAAGLLTVPTLGSAIAITLLAVFLSFAIMDGF